MKKLTDEEIQKLLEENLSTPGDDFAEDDDIKAYQFLFESLKEEPLTGLPYNFSKKVSAQIKVANNRRQDVKLYFFVTIAIMLTVAIVAGFMAVFNYKSTLQLVNVIGTYKWVILFILAGIVAVQYADQKVVKRNKGLV
jgi:sterol desaturase/sphingolipid hydroxylase (fatty acid hydroxylase superfamily)